MSKAVLISIQPKWCELIAKGKKTLEVRKTRPKLETPFKCYIYCTKPKSKNDLGLCRDIDNGDTGLVFKGNYKAAENHSLEIISGKVIGEFVCDEIERVDIPYPAYQDKLDKRYIEQSCVPYNALHRYCYHDDAYFWLISDLKIYDKLRELSEFRTKCRHYDDGLCGDCKYYDYANNESYRYEECAVDGLKPITRPPQSWCYVEEREENETPH